MLGPIPAPWTKKFSKRMFWTTPLLEFEQMDHEKQTSDLTSHLLGEDQHSHMSFEEPRPPSMS
jgi:hypothetical protein